jgi:hypothetical protein
MRSRRGGYVGGSSCSHHPRRFAVRPLLRQEGNHFVSGSKEIHNFSLQRTRVR